MRGTIAPSKDRKGTNDTGKRTPQFKQGRKKQKKNPRQEQINIQQTEIIRRGMTPALRRMKEMMRTQRRPAYTVRPTHKRLSAHPQFQRRRKWAHKRKGMRNGIGNFESGKRNVARSETF